MLASQLACPHCRSPVILNKNLPAGVEVLCPRCKNFFKIPDQVSGEVPGAKVSGQHAAEVTGLPGDSSMFSKPGSVSSNQGMPSWASTVAGRLMLVMGSCLAFLLVGTALVLWCFSEARPEKKEEKPSLPEEGPAEVSLKFPKKQKSQARTLLSLSRGEMDQAEKLKQKGVDFLKKTQTPEGCWHYQVGNEGWTLEMAALGGLTLLECGVPPQDESVQKAAAAVRKNHLDIDKTYGVSLMVLFLDRLNDPQDKNLIKNLAMRLVKGQTQQGAWSYTVPHLSEDDEEELIKILSEMGRTSWPEYVKNHPEAKPPKNWQHLAPFNPVPHNRDHYALGNGDHSNTQFGLLALWAARRHGLSLDQPIKMVVKRFRATQEGDGHWNYYLSQPNLRLPGESMTCAGLLALAMGYGLDMPELKEAAGPLQDPAIQKGLAFLSKHINQPPADPDRKPTMASIYYLWSLERVGVLFQLPQIGGKDWYRWGLRILATYQAPNGSWQFFPINSLGFATSADTSLALLFLQQANLAQDLTDKLQDLQEGQAGPGPGIKE